MRGFPLSELDNWNTGDLIDWACEHDRLQKIARGEYVPDDFERYEQLKAMENQIEELHKAGKIREDKYRSYRAEIDRCEMILKG